jgi:hypothetical protein
MLIDGISYTFLSLALGARPRCVYRRWHKSALYFLAQAFAWGSQKITHTELRFHTPYFQRSHVTRLARGVAQVI